MLRAGRPFPPFHFTPSAPRNIDGIQLPKADALVVARAMGLLPPEDVFIKEFFRRRQELDSPKARRWLQHQLRAHMPDFDPEIPGRSICGVCASNLMGHPIAAHSQDDCIVEQVWRAPFVATNTRAFCPECRGKSDHHTTCIPADEPCRKCERNGMPNMRHQPPSGLCGLAPNEVEPYFTKHRKAQYMKIAEMSVAAPMQIRAYNDEPLTRESQDYDTSLGIRPFVDYQGEIPQVIYATGATFHGLCPQHFTRTRYLVDTWIDNMSRDFYLQESNIPADASPELRQQIADYKAQEQRMAQERREARMARHQPAARLPQVPSNPREESLVVALSKIAQYELPGETAQEALDRVFASLKIKETFEELSAKHKGRSLAAKALSLNDMINEVNKVKVTIMANLQPEIYSTLRTFAKQAAEYQQVKLPEDYVPRTLFHPDKRAIVGYVQAAYTEKDQVRIIKELLFAMLGHQEHPQEVESDQYWMRGFGDLSNHYAELLLRVSTILANTERPFKTIYAHSCLQLQTSLDAKHVVVPVPSPQCFVLEPPNFMKIYYYNKWIVELAAELIH
ncbi:hypothetical protein CAEBREN_24054 [Caenorhabditis brenneri]|uniref:Uncharacterized protein n=1 Tax=Caenorhabditis brenneri TaxID=135651 RepID=G0N6S2_CAEBE|nr:hypothetical protein CAEBREN_24054 [Caenorhabditis brenneri]